MNGKDAFLKMRVKCKLSSGVELIDILVAIYSDSPDVKVKIVETPENLKMFKHKELTFNYNEIEKF